MGAVAYLPVPDGNGGIRHELRPVNDTAPATKGRKRKRVVPDPIKADGNASAQTLRQFIERVERVDCEVAEMQADRQDILSEAKSQGYSTKTMLAIIARRKKEKHILDEDDDLLETYLAALGLR